MSERIESTRALHGGCRPIGIKALAIVGTDASKEAQQGLDQPDNY
jgi:hypothetical protein